MIPPEPARVLQLYSPEKAAEFAGMSAADRLRWLDEIRDLCARASVAAAAASRVSDGKTPRP